MADFRNCLKVVECRGTAFKAAVHGQELRGLTCPDSRFDRTSIKMTCRLVFLHCTRDGFNALATDPLDA